MVLAVALGRGQQLVEADEDHDSRHGAEEQTRNRAIDEALQAKEEGKEKTILFNLSGHGFMDMTAYDNYLAGNLEDYEYPAEMVQESLKHLPKVKL